VTGKQVATRRKSQTPSTKRGRGKNKITEETRDLIDSLEVNPIEGMIRVFNGELLCFRCRDKKGNPTGRVSVFNPVTGREKRIVCPNCNGSTLEYVSVETRSNMLKEVAKYYAPQLKSLEVDVNGSGDGDDELPETVAIVYASKSRKKS
jgi:hypothetical protein